MEAERWYGKAAKQGYVPAYVNLGELALRTQNYGAAMQWYQQAADQGDREAAFKLGALYDQGVGGGDKSKALDWYKRAAGQGHPEAQRRYQQLMGLSQSFQGEGKK